MQHLGDVEAGVEADEVGELSGPIGMVGAELHRGVDVLGGAEALLQREAGLVEHRDQDAVHDEAGHVLRRRTVVLPIFSASAARALRRSRRWSARRG